MVDHCPFEGTVINQRFEVGPMLGQGSLGRVFEVRDRKQGGRRRALKVIRPDIMDGAAANFLKHEFRVLSHLDHPNIARVYDFGRVPGRSELYFTEELVEGYHFVKVLRRAPISVFMDVFAQFVRAIGFVHSKGVLHSDIKPKNVYITARRDGSLRVKLIDFHLCRVGEVFTDKLVRGTISYMAPEMIRGDSVDCRADLYGVGVMAYEALSRRRPFRQTTPVDVLRAHLEIQPKPLGELRDDIPPALCQLIDRLLSKDPDERPSTARDILRIVRDEVDRDLSLETKRTRLAFLRSGVLVSRDGCLNRIRRQVESIGTTHEVNELPNLPLESTDDFLSWVADHADGESMSSLDTSISSGGLPEWTGKSLDENWSRVLVLEGEEGIGKTRILHEARIECQLAGVPFFSARAGRVGSRPLGPFLVLLRALIEHLNLGELLKEVAPDGCLDPAKLLARHRAKHSDGGVIDALAALFGELADALPFVAAIDDFGDADTASLDLAQKLASSKHNALYILTSNDCTEMKGWSDAQRMRLNCLSHDEAKTLISSMLGEPVQAGFTSRVFSVTGGNPRFTEETMRHLADEGLLTTEEGALSAQMGDLFSVEVPASVQDVLQRRVDRLSDEERRVLGALSLTLRARPADFLSTVSQVSRKKTGDLLQLFEEHGWVRSHADVLGRDLYWVTQSPLRRLIAQDLSAELFETLQGRMAKILESRHPAAESFWSLSGDPDWVHDRAEELAYHYALSGNSEKAYQHSLAAAEVARTRAQRTRARRLYSLTIELSKGYAGSHGEARRLAHFRIGQACSYLGRYSEALERFEILREDESGSPWEAATVLFHCARLRLRLGEFRKARDEINLGLEIVEKGFKGSEKLRARLYVEQAALNMWQGQGKSASESAKMAIEALEREKLQSEMVVARHIQALSERFRGREARIGSRPRMMKSWLESLCVPEVDCEDMSVVSREEERERLDRLLVESIALELASENREEAALALNIRGNLRRAQGRYQESFEDYERAVMLCEELENVPGTSLARFNVGQLFVEVGDFDNGDACLSLAYEGADYCDLHWLKGFIHVAWARLWRLRDEPGRWRESLANARVAFDCADFHIGSFELSLEEIEGSLGVGDWVGAREHFTNLTIKESLAPTPDQSFRRDLLRAQIDFLEPGHSAPREEMERWLKDWEQNVSWPMWVEWQVQNDLTRARIYKKMNESLLAKEALKLAKQNVDKIASGLLTTLGRCYVQDTRRRSIEEALGNDSL
ncbi:MAG: protein kinase [Planctomycetota bacterium]|nr:protein kinase [Planctomycetota bacterium]